MSGRFRLDPRAPPVERPAQRREPPAAAPRAGSPPPSSAAPGALPPTAPVARAAPRPAPARQAPARGRRRLLVVAVVALLLLGGVVAAVVSTVLGYPDKYVLEGREIPSGMSNARLTQSEMREVGMTENPGLIDWERSAFSDAFARAGMDDPDRAHGQVLQAGSAHVVVLALKYANADDARAAGQDLRSLCSFGAASRLQAIVLRDDDVLVTIFSDDGASRAQVRSVSDALRDKVDDLQQVCST